MPSSLFTPAQLAVDAYRQRARKDPLALSGLMIAARGETVRNHPMHRTLVDLLVACRVAARNVAVHFPPEHGKSAIVQPFILDSLARDQRLRVGIISADRDLAEEHLTRIRKGIISGVSASVHPHLRPDTKMGFDHGEFSKSKIYLEGRDSPAVEVLPLDGATEGHRLDLIWLDDCCTRQGIFSPAIRERAIGAIFGTFLNRLTPGGMVIITNNCWHRDDAFHRARNSTAFSTLWIAYPEDCSRIDWEIIRPPETWEGVTSGSWPLWEQWPVERLQAKQAESRPFWRRLYEGRAIQAEECRFPTREAWATYNPESIPAYVRRGANLYGYLDPAGGRRAHKGDFAALIAILQVAPDQALVVEAWLARKEPGRQIGAAFDVHRKWLRLTKGFRAFQIETLPKEELWIREPIETAGKKLRTAGDKAGWMQWSVDYPTEPKESRIEHLDSWLRNGRLMWPSDLQARLDGDGEEAESWRQLVEQLEEWPMADHDDGPDALAGVIAMVFPNPDLAEKVVVVDTTAGFDTLPDGY